MIKINYICKPVLIVLALHLLSANCKANEPTEVLNFTPAATFGGVDDPAVMAWLRDGTHVRIFDSYTPLKYCERPELLLCIIEPYEILLPRKRGKIDLKIAGSTYEVMVSSGADSPLPENVCEAYAFWLRVRNKHLSLDSWYFFNRRWGLLQFITFVKGDELDQVPGDIFLRSSGRVFVVEELCEKGNK